MSDTVVPRTAAAIGCNFCGAIKVFNRRHSDIVWVLCKDCQLVADCAGFRRSLNVPIPGHNFTRPSDWDLNSPTFGATVTPEQFCWFTKERLDQFIIRGEDCYHLLDYVPLSKPYFDTYNIFE